MTRWLAGFGDALAAERPGRRPPPCSPTTATGATSSPSPGTSRPLEGRAAIADMLDATLARVQPSGWQITDGQSPPRPAGSSRPGSASRPRPAAAAGSCGCADGQCVDPAHHAVRAQGLRGAAAAPRRPKGAEHGANRGRTTWQEKREHEAQELGYTDAAVRAGRRRRPGRHRARRPAAPAGRAHASSSTSTPGPATSGAAATSRCACTTRSGTTTCPT